MKKTDSVKTPLSILHRVQRKFFGNNVLFDPTPFNPKFNPSKDRCCTTYDWPDYCFFNPPYSRGASFLELAHSQWKRTGGRIVCLMKLGILGTQKFQKISKDATIFLLNNRIVFDGYVGKALFYSVIIVFGLEKKDRGKFELFDSKKIYSI